jgi:hypothetical protein
MALTPSRLGGSVTTDWHPKPRDLKWYPNFDKYLPPEKALEIATDPQRVAINPFFPFLRYIKKWRPYRPSGKPPKGFCRKSSPETAAVYDRGQRVRQGGG